MEKARAKFEGMVDGLILRASGRELDCARDSFKMACDLHPPGKGKIAVVASCGTGSVGFLCDRDKLQVAARSLVEFDPTLREKDAAIATLAVVIEKELETGDGGRLTRAVGPLAWEVLKHSSPEEDDGIIVFAHVVRRLDSERTVLFLTLVPQS